MTVKKNKGRWTDEEHKAFVRAMSLCGKNYKAMACMVPTRTATQIRTHGQKYIGKINSGKKFPEEPYASQYDKSAGQSSCYKGAYLYASQQQQEMQQQQAHTGGGVDSTPSVAPSTLPPTTAMTTPAIHAMPTPANLSAPPSNAPPATRTATWSTGVQHQQDGGFASGAIDDFQQQHFNFGVPLLLDSPLVPLAPLATDMFPGQGNGCAGQAQQEDNDLMELAQYLLCDSDSNSNVGGDDGIMDIVSVL